MKSLANRKILWGLLCLVASCGLMSAAGQLDAQVVVMERHRAAIVVVDKSQFSEEPVVVVIGPAIWPTIDAMILIREGAVSEEAVARAMRLVRDTFDGLAVDAEPQDLVLRIEGVEPVGRDRGQAADIVPFLVRQDARSRELEAEMGEVVLIPPSPIDTIGATRIRGLAYFSFSVRGAG